MARSNLVWEELNLKTRKSHHIYDPHHILLAPEGTVPVRRMRRKYKIQNRR
jgi:hypothetical protein